MFKKASIALFAVLFFSVFLFAQGGRNNLIRWEYLEVSGTKYSSGYNQTTRYYRDYNFLTSATNFAGKNSLEWMKDSGWELVSVVNNGESPVSLYFKRPFKKVLTENEITRLKKEYETEFQTPPKSVLVDLDEQEFKQKINDFNRTEEVKLRTALAQIKNLPLKIIRVQSNSSVIDTPRVSAEMVLDATSLLVKNENTYRSSEAEKVYQAAAKQIIESLGLAANSNFRGNAQGISKSYIVPQPVGKFNNFYDEFSILISLVINTENQQVIVAQGVIYSSRIKEKPIN